MKRRNLFKAIAAGSLTAAHPLACLLGRNAMAQTGTAPIRSLFIVHPNGCLPDLFFPAAGSRDLPLMSEPLSEVYDNLVFIDGITFPGGLYQTAQTEGLQRALTGRTYGARGTESSIDVLMGKEDWANRETTRIRVPSAQIGVASHSEFFYHGLCWDGPTKLGLTNNPRALYAKLFGVEGASLQGPMAQLLSAAKADLGVIHAQIGNNDGQRQRLEQHTDALMFLENKLANAGVNPFPKGCQWPNISAAPFIDDDADSLAWNATELMSLASDLQQDIAIAAFSCGITKAIAFNYGASPGSNPVRVPGSVIFDHSSSHMDPKTFARSKRWWMGEIAKFIKKLANTPDQNGSLLDNTIVMTLSNMGNGDRHDHWRIPVVLASGVNNNVGLVTGRSLDWRNSPYAEVQNIVGVTWQPGDPINNGVPTPPSIGHTEILDTIRRVAGYTTFQMPQVKRGIMEAWTGGLEPR